MAKFKHSTVVSFFNEQIDSCVSDGLLGTARNYRRTLNSFRNFLGGMGADIPFSMVSGKMIMEYERWLLSRGVMRNSSSFYIRNLRAVYNKAVKVGIVGQKHPFDNVYTGIDRTRKRAVEEDVIMGLLKMDLNYSKALALSRDLFVFSYCTRGMSFVDVAFLRKRDVEDGTITYVRRKTGRRMSVRMEPCMYRIISRYEAETAGTPYVFPIISSSDPTVAYHQYQIALSYHNRKLKRIADLLGERRNLSTYTARHTWATTARNHFLPLSVISAGMGHTSEKTTQIYLADLETAVVDKANQALLKGLNEL